MSDTLGSITMWLSGVRTGDEVAVQKVWDRYVDRLRAVARRRLDGAARRVADEDDVAQDAFRSFFDGASRRRFPRLDDRDDLWRILVVITARKAADQRAHERRKKRGGGRVRGESRLDAAGSGVSRGLEEIIGDEPSPAFAAEVAEELEALLERLGDTLLRRIALLKMDGHTLDEIAEETGCARRTVARKIALIKRRLESVGPMPDAAGEPDS